MDMIVALISPLVGIAVFGALFLVCAYGWFVSERAYMTGPSTFSFDPKPTPDGSDRQS